MNISKEDFDKLKQNDRIEILLSLGLGQGKYINNSIITSTLLIITTISCLFFPLISFLFLILSFIKIIQDKKNFNKFINNIFEGYFETKPRGKK